ncbi:hypothetical protein FNF27_04725 [Cafeteria roenbergensis]|uniref:UBC core domain-containing protein n=1 Tax=Cafeteria roenbergensis TaxID=33653 RepID=A0A5A8EAM9_CAFRO|nr:hypothetical protein FNF27_04725 [Cafeteria roenbergensis]
MAAQRRLLRELGALGTEPLEGIACWGSADDPSLVEATLEGPGDTPYAGGQFRMEVRIPPRYPFEPPIARFLTPVYHPNIDKRSGTICASVLKMPPKGDWQPSMGVGPLLVSLRSLLSAPNAADGLDAEATSLYRRNRAEFTRTATDWTKRYALGGGGGGAARASKRPRESTGLEAGKGATAEEDAAPADPGAAPGPELRGGITSTVRREPGRPLRAAPPAASPAKSHVKGVVIWRRERRTTWQ